MNENPYSPFDPHWQIVEAYFRKKRQRKLQTEIHKFSVSLRKRNMHLIFTTPNIAFDIPQFLAACARAPKSGCPHCGSVTKHTKTCSDQQIIDAYRDLKDI